MNEFKIRLKREMRSKLQQFSSRESFDAVEWVSGSDNNAQLLCGCDDDGGGGGDGDDGDVDGGVDGDDDVDVDVDFDVDVDVDGSWW